jgi:hypothetical protein
MTARSNSEQPASLNDRAFELAQESLALSRTPGQPLAAVESVRTERIHRAVFGHAKIVQVIEGRARIETATGTHELLPGMTMALGAGMWCTVAPAPWVRIWTIYFDEDFLRSHMRWVLPDMHRVRPRAHPEPARGRTGGRRGRCWRASLGSASGTNWAWRTCCAHATWNG